MIWRGPWDGRWDGSWEGQDQPLAPGFVRGLATLRIEGFGLLEAPSDALAGVATITIGATGQLTSTGVAPPVDVTPAPAPGTYGSVGQRTNVVVLHREDLSHRITARRQPEVRDPRDVLDLSDIIAAFDELLAA